MTYLALDVGTRKIGVAVGSTDLRLATPLRVFRRGRLEEDAERLRLLASQYDAEQLIVGFPREVDGTIGAQAEYVKDYAERLGKVLGMPFQFIDERYSTAEALARRRVAGVSERQGRPTIDAAAATIILQDFFDMRS